MNLARLADTILLAWGWRRMLIAFLAGASTVLALPPSNVWPVPFVTFPILVWLVDGSAGGRFGGVLTAAVAGWWFGFGYFLAGLYWIGFAFLVDAKTFGWLLPFAVIALPAGMALYTAFGLALARLLWTRGAPRVLALAVALTAADWLRGHLFTGFPWNAFGYALIAPEPFGLALAQTGALVGLWGLTFIAIAVYASPAVLADAVADTRRPWLPLALSGAVILSMAAYGMLRLRAPPAELVAGVRLRIMQPNLPQDEKFNYGQKQAVMSRYLALSDRASGPQTSGVRDVTHLIWPESAFPFFLTREPDALEQIARFLPEGTVLITGAVRAPETVPNPAITQAYNSIYVLDHDGSIVSIYDKVHLVPFGEYLPFQQQLERIGLLALTKVRGGFIAGPRRRTMPVAKAPNFVPLICYEAVFPGEATTGEPAGWMLNVTNDGWFGLSPGPYQHFAQARLRAIEEGLPLVRAANTGISAVVDPLGRVTASLPLGTEGVLDAGLPRAIAPPLYSKLRDIPVVLIMAAALLLLLLLLARARSRNA